MRVLRSCVFVIDGTRLLRLFNEMLNSGGSAKVVMNSTLGDGSHPGAWMLDRLLGSCCGDQRQDRLRNDVLRQVCVTVDTEVDESPD